MKTTTWLRLASLLALLTPSLAAAITPSDAEMAQARQWTAAKFDGQPNATATSEPFFSFTYDGQPASALLKNWKVTRSSRSLDAQRTEHTLCYTDPKTGLELRGVGVEFRDFPAIEWVLYLKNTGKADTPILESIQALDATLPMPKAEQAVLHWSTGGVATFDDFAPQEKPLQGEKFHLQPGGGRSSSNVLPFFNVAAPGGGVVTAVGWTGEWAADFAASAQGVALQAGMARTHLRLHPGEEIRTPRMLLLFYGQDRWRGNNLLRQFLLRHHRPDPNKDGKPWVAPVTWGNWGGTPAEISQDHIEKIIEHKLACDYYWLDAGWYGKPGSTTEQEWATNAGNWTLNQGLYPEGMKALSDLLKTDGRKLMVWFEPERVMDGSAWAQEHPEWCLRLPNNNTLLMNLGNPEACQFVIDFCSSRIAEYGIGCYRQDFNMDPLEYWRANDAEDRQGISEIRHIEGLYRFWDALLKRHPGLIIDNCASGGRRIDLETTGRATPFWRTDGPRDAVAHQCHSFGLQAWVPLSAISEDREGDTYEFRSSMASGLCINWAHAGDGPGNPQQKFPADFPFDWCKKTLDQYLELRHFYYGDYYPLTPYTQAQTAWLAWQCDEPQSGTGMVQAFRRQECPTETTRIKLHGLEAQATYVLANVDVPGTTERSGRELMEQGLSVRIREQPGAAVVTYRKK